MGTLPCCDLDIGRWREHLARRAPVDRPRHQPPECIGAGPALDEQETLAVREEGGITMRDVLGGRLGLADEALRGARMALGLFPASHDAWIRQFREFDLALVEINAGNHDAAIDRLEQLLAKPSDLVSVADLRLSSLYDSLRRNPAFARLLGPS